MKRYLILVLILFSCTSKQNREEAGNVNIVSEEAEPSKISSKSFEVFFSEFVADSNFQISRIKFPLELRTYDFDANLDIEYVEMSDWKFNTFEYDSSYFYQHSDAFEQVYEYFPDSTILGHRGIDNGIYVNYVFKLHSGKWYFDLIDDYSN